LSLFFLAFVILADLLFPPLSPSCQCSLAFSLIWGRWKMLGVLRGALSRFSFLASPEYIHFYSWAAAWNVLAFGVFRMGGSVLCVSLRGGDLVLFCCVPHASLFTFSCFSMLVLFWEPRLLSSLGTPFISYSFAWLIISDSVFKIFFRFPLPPHAWRTGTWPKTFFFFLPSPLPPVLFTGRSLSSLRFLCFLPTFFLFPSSLIWSWGTRFYLGVPRFSINPPSFFFTFRSRLR